MNRLDNQLIFGFLGSFFGHLTIIFSLFFLSPTLIPKPTCEKKAFVIFTPVRKSKKGAVALNSQIKRQKNPHNLTRNLDVPSKANHENNDRVKTNVGENKIVSRTHPILLNADVIKVPYPEKAKKFRVEGVVKLRLTVTSTGFVSHAEVVSGPSFGLHGAALAIAKKLRFLPAIDDKGNEISAEVFHDVIFKLHSELEGA